MTKWNSKSFLKWGGIAVVIVSLVWVLFAPRSIEVEVAKVSIGTYKEILRTDGILRSKEKYLINAFADGVAGRITLKPGDTVKKNQELLKLFWDRYVPMKSPIDGVVSQVFHESEGPVRRGESLIEIINPKRLEAVAEALTTEAAGVQVGAQTWITGYGKDERLDARVSKVNRAGFKKISALGVEEERTEILAEPTSVPPELLSRLGHNFHVDLEILISSQDHVLKIATGALFRDGQEWAVYRIEDGRARKTQIKIGKRGKDEALVLSGIEKDMPVIVFPGDTVKDGVRVQVRSR